MLLQISVHIRLWQIKNHLLFYSFIEPIILSKVAHYSQIINTLCAVLGHYSLDLSFSSSARTKNASSRSLTLCHYSLLRMRKM